MWAMAALLTACGGGGGSSGGSAPPPPPAPAPAPSGPPFDVSAAWRNLLTANTTKTWTVNGTASNGSAFTITLTNAAPQTAQVFGVTGATSSASDATAQLAIAGGALTVQTTSTTSYFDPATFVVTGVRKTPVTPTGPATCSIPSASVASASVTPPASAAVGANGPLQTFDDLNGCVPASTKTGTSVTTWSMEAEGAVNLFCQNTTSTLVGNSLEAKQATCLEVAQDGTLLTRARVTIAQGTVTLVAKNY
jgi:hypothetical protein